MTLTQALRIKLLKQNVRIKIRTRNEGERKKERMWGKKGCEEGEKKGDSEAGAPWKQSSGRTDGWGKAVPEALFLRWSVARKEYRLQLTFSQGTMHVSPLFLCCCPEK